MAVFQRARVGFQGDFRLRVQREGRPARRQNRRHLLGGQEAWRATAKEDGAAAARRAIGQAGTLACKRDFIEQRRDILLAQP